MTAITWEVATLSNGLRVVTTPVSTAQSVSVNVFVGVGSRAEDRRTNGVSHYLEHMLFKGTERRPTAIDIAEAIEGAGGVLNAYTTKELTCYWNQVPFDRLDLAADVLADMIAHATLSEEEIDRERTVVQAEIQRAHDQPAAWASELLAKACFGDQPIGWPIAGSLETVSALTRQDMVDHVRAWYTPPNMVVSVAGATTHDEVVRLAETLFGGLEGRPAPPVPPASPEAPRERVIVEPRDIAQANLGIAVRALARQDPDRYALMILNTVLGRGMSSRLFKEVREKRGLAYSVGSGVARYTDTGVLSISAGVSPEKLEEAATVILEELRRLADEPVGDAELKKAKDYTIGSFRLGLETTMALAQRAGEALLMTGDIEPVDEVVERLGAVSAEDVRRVAERIVRPDALSMAVVGPAGPDPERLAALLASVA